MNMHPENQFGYLCLTHTSNKEVILVKANTIKTIDHRKGEHISTITFNDEHYILVNQNIKQIVDQLENIHPSLR